MAKTYVEIECLECGEDNSVDVDVVYGEFEGDDGIDESQLPKACVACNAALDHTGEASYREDFHADC